MSIESSFNTAIEAGKLAGHRTLVNGNKVEHQLDDVLFLASGTKLLTTIALLQAVEDGLFSLDQGLEGYGLPDHVLIDNELVPAKKPITLRQLLSHTSGLNYPFTDPAIQKWTDEHPADTTTQHKVEELYNAPLGFQPGSNWTYGTGLDWAGRVLEKKTGETLGQWIRQRVARSKDAEFYPAKGLRERMVDLNPFDNGGGKAVSGGVDINVICSGDFGGHGLFTTAPVYLDILRSLLLNNGELLRPETVDEMFHDQLGAAKSGFDSQMNEAQGIALMLRQGTTQAVGFGLGGLLTLEDEPGRYGKGTLTWTGGITFTWFIDRQNGLCGLCALQATVPVDVALIEELKQVFRKDIYKIKNSWERK